jgi:uncharacterized phiE125 gp8 family phage protein
MRALMRVSQPSFEPVTAGEILDWVVAPDADSAMLTTIVADARDELELELGRATVNSTWKLTLDAADLYMPNGDDRTEVYLPVVPVVSVSSVVTYNTANTSATFSTASYAVIVGEAGRVVLNYDCEWPDDLREVACVDINFTAGYGTTTSAVTTAMPRALKTGIRELAAYYWKNRGEGYILARALDPASGGDIRYAPRQVEKILSKLQRYRVKVRS